MTGPLTISSSGLSPISGSIVMTEEQVKALFVLVRIPVLKIWELPNRYFCYQAGEDPETTQRNALWRATRPSWLVKIPQGVIDIGPRKRVLEIRWDDTPVRYSPEAPITPDNVTKGASYVHAWSVQEAFRHLTLLQAELEKHPRIWP